MSILIREINSPASTGLTKASTRIAPIVTFTKITIFLSSLIDINIIYLNPYSFEAIPATVDIINRVLVYFAIIFLVVNLVYKNTSETKIELLPHFVNQ